jgi:hypothetical protein
MLVELLINFDSRLQPQALEIFRVNS